MPVFPSREWIEDFCAAFTVQPQAGQTAAVLDGVYRFVIEPDGPLTERQVYDVSIRPGANGERPDVKLLDGAEAQPRLTLTAAYRRWQQLIRGELDILMAVMLGRLRISGSIDPLRRANTRPLVDALRGVESTWLD